jgi:hypothetical protein
MIYLFTHVFILARPKAQLDEYACLIVDSRLRLPSCTFIASGDRDWKNVATLVANHHGLHGKLRRLSSIVDVTSNSMNITFMLKVGPDQAHDDVFWVRASSPYSELRFMFSVDYATDVVLSEVHDWIHFESYAMFRRLRLPIIHYSFHEV